MRIFLFLLSVFTMTAAFPEEIGLSHDKILVTSEGIFINLFGHLTQAQSLEYMGNGVYVAEYYGQCGRCGWVLDQTGKCTNQNCNQYGPRERD